MSPKDTSAIFIFSFNKLTINTGRPIENKMSTPVDKNTFLNTVGLYMFILSSVVECQGL